MSPTTKQLRDYQVRLVTDVCRATEDILVEQPTGSGKTVQIVALVAMHLGRRFSHAGGSVDSGAQPNALIKGSRGSILGSVKRGIHYLRQPRQPDHPFSFTHPPPN